MILQWSVWEVATIYECASLPVCGRKTEERTQECVSALQLHCTCPSPLLLVCMWAGESLLVSCMGFHGKHILYNDCTAARPGFIDVCERPEQEGWRSFMASFMKSQGHPINGEHSRNQPVAVTWDANRYILLFYQPFSDLLYRFFFLHCCSLMAIFIRVACKLLRVMPNYCRTELPNDYSIPDGQIKVQFSSQTGARVAHGREMLKTLYTFLFAQHLKKSKKSTLFVSTKNSWLFWSIFLYWPALQTHSSIKPTENE